MAAPVSPESWLPVPGLDVEVSDQLRVRRGSEILVPRPLGDQKVVFLGRTPHAVDALLKLARGEELEPAPKGKAKK
jgi:hypothetical protein